MRIRARNIRISSGGSLIAIIVTPPRALHRYLGGLLVATRFSVKAFDDRRDGQADDL